MELETRRLLLRPLRDDDAPAMARALNNYEVSKNLSRVPFPYTLEDARFFIDLQRDFDPQSKICAITFRAAPDELLGVIAYERKAHGEAFEFGYWLSESCWGMRIMTEAAQAMVVQAFLSDGVETLTSGFWNPVSGRLLRNLGFVETQRSTIFSLAQNREIPAMKLELTHDMWLAQQESRAA
jgi:RimJ/RimL family protein N-acetyltransferase